MSVINLKTAIQNFRRDRSGGVAVTFAIVSVPVLLLTTSAIEYTNLVRERARVQNTLDSTLLAYKSDPAPDSSAKKTLYENRFKAQLLNSAGTDVQARVKELEITPNTDYVEGTVKLGWGRLFGFMSDFGAFNVPIKSRVDGGTKTTTTTKTVPTTTTTTTYKYVDVHLILDNSGSMLLSAEPNLKPFKGRSENRSVDCEYACHDSVQLSQLWDKKEGGKPIPIGYYGLGRAGSPPVLDYYEETRNPDGSYKDKLKLRLDIVKDAAKKFIDDMNTFNTAHGNHVRLAIYKMGPPQTPDFTDAVGKGMPRKFMLHDNLETDAVTLKNIVNSLPEQGQKVGGIEFGLFQVINSEWLGVSDPRPAIEEVVRNINPKTQGDGTRNNPEKWVIIVSDGMFQELPTAKTDYQLYTSEWDNDADRSSKPSKMGTIRSYKYTRWVDNRVYKTEGICSSIQAYKVKTITVKYYPNTWRPADEAESMQNFWSTNCHNQGPGQDVVVESDEAKLNGAFTALFKSISTPITTTVNTTKEETSVVTTRENIRLTK